MSKKAELKEQEKSALEIKKEKLHELIETITEVDTVHVYHETKDFGEMGTKQVTSIEIHRRDKIQVFDKTEVYPEFLDDMGEEDEDDKD